jgi:hypothetical protein
MRQKIPVTPAEYDHTRVIERPDGFFWLDKETGEIGRASCRERVS